MRVVAGTYGGRSLRAPRGESTRPTADRVREALFSILGDEVRDARVLDLFAGSGALGIEALSRGAREAVFVDSSTAALAVVRANLRSLGAMAQVTRADALAFLRTASAASRQYDLVFLDTPYAAAGRLGTQLSALVPGVMAPGSTVVAESDRRNPLALALPLRDQRRYGDTLISLHDPS